VLRDERIHGDVLDEPDSLEDRGRGESGERVERRPVPIARAEAAAPQVVGADPGHHLRDPLPADELDLHAEPRVQRHRRAQRGQAQVGLGDEQVAVLLEVVPAARE